MSHLSVEQQWQLARAQLTVPEAAACEAHLVGCDGCRKAMADVRLAVGVLRAVPEPPPLPPMLAQRVGARLADAVEASQARGFTQWWSPRWWALAAVAAAMTVLLVRWATRVEEGPRAPEVAVQPVPAPVAETPVLVPPPPPPQKRTARVASAVKASSTVAQELAEGAVVKTERGGSAWLHLPDGTRAGVTGASAVQLVTLETAAVALDLQRGSVAMVVPHREDRVLTVQAGEVRVRDLGTRFVVSREVARVVVAVEEGQVAVDVANQSRVVHAGHAVSWHDGVLEPLDFASPALPVPQPPGGARAHPQVASPADDAPPPAPLAPEDEWAGLEPTSPSGVATRPPAPTSPPPPAAVDSASPPPPPASPTGEAGFSLRFIERRLQQLTRDVQAPFPPVGGTLRQVRAREVARLADSGDCEGALELGNAWLSAPANAGDEAVLRRAVLQQKMRCLIKLGRTAEATEVWQSLGGASVPKPP